MQSTSVLSKYKRSNEEFSLREYFIKIMNEYLDAKKKSLTKHPLGSFVRKEVKASIYNYPFITKELLVEGSVGQGKWAEVPWIALMNKKITDSTTKGVYIVYLFSSDMKKVYLTLNQGTEDLMKKNGKVEGYRLLEIKKEEIRKLLKIDNMRLDNNINLNAKSIRGKSYEQSTIAYIEYTVNNLPSDEQLINDLNVLINYYNVYVNSVLGITENDVSTISIKDDNMEQLNVEDTIEHIKNFISDKGFSFPESLIENFYLSLKTKPFVILAGISGTGKTKLVNLFAEALGANKDNNRYRLIPVRPEWNDPSDLLGYKDLSGHFNPGVLTQILDEATLPENKNKPYFICLDEMNLARVEHYFSDVLSLLETTEWKNGEIITNEIINISTLSIEDQNKYGKLYIPENVYIIGTVNMDETTYPFSKKVLDRANTIEFNYIDLTNYPNKSFDEINISSISVKNELLKSHYIKLSDMYEENKKLVHETTEKLISINKILEPIHAHIGFRTRDAICFYMAYNSEFELLSSNTAFDFQMLQKILPRIQGSSQTIREVLIQLLVFTLPSRSADKNKLVNGEIEVQQWYKDNKQNVQYPKTAEKLLYMLRRLDEDGFTSYWIS